MGCDGCGVPPVPVARALSLPLTGCDDDAVTAFVDCAALQGGGARGFRASAVTLEVRRVWAVGGNAMCPRVCVSRGAVRAEQWTASKRGHVLTCVLTRVGVWWCVVAAGSGSVGWQERRYGGLKDEDRIFTNLYGEQDWRLKDAVKRVRAAVNDG